MRVEVDARCRNEKCPYLAHTPDGFCCGTCANAAVVGDAGYALHSERGCKRERIVTGVGGIEWGPSVPGPSVLRGCLAVVAVLVIIVVALFVGAAIFGRMAF